MPPIRLVHIADAHLETPFYGREESLRRRLKEACRQGFRNALDEAIQRQAHCVAIAGDLFDNEQLSFATEIFLIEQMERLEKVGIKVFYATGNHDPGRAGYRAHELNWPENVKLFRNSSPQTVAITDSAGEKIGNITAAGHNSAVEKNNLAARFPAVSGPLPHIGLLHAQVMSAKGSEAHDRYAPCSPDDLTEKGMDYWALGHIHQRQRIRGRAPAWYCGNIQGRNPRETGPKGILYVEIGKNQEPAPEFIPVSPVVWHEITVNPQTAAATFEDLSARVAGEIEKNISLKDSTEHLVRVNLVGETPLAGELSDADNIARLTERIQNELDVCWLELRPLHIVPPVDPEPYRDSSTVLGETLRIIERLKKDDALLEEVSPEQIAGQGDMGKKEYLRQLLKDLDKHAASLLLRRDKE